MSHNWGRNISSKTIYSPTYQVPYERLLQGDHVSECEIKRTTHATQICWHPSKKILAVGWATGEISIWNQTDRDLSDVFPLHKSEITILRFSSNGSRLLTGDTVRNRCSHHHHSTFACLFSKYPDDFAFQSGLLVMWKLDQKGRVSQSPVCQHHCGDQILECVLRPPPPVDPAQYVSEKCVYIVYSFIQYGHYSLQWHRRFGSCSSEWRRKRPRHV